MEFIEQIKELSIRASDEKLLQNIKTEEATKTALIMPFIQALGYNVFDPTEVVPEYVADIGKKKERK